MDSDPQRMGPALYLIARVYSVEDRAHGLRGEERLELRQRLSAPVMEKLHQYLYTGELKEIGPGAPPSMRFQLCSMVNFGECRLFQPNEEPNRV